MKRPSRPEPKWMDRALELAERGRYTVSPNPMVGAVVVRGGRAVGEGWHRRAGGAHAEVAALAAAAERARGGDLYLTLEPCVHFGRTPPCVPGILAAGIRRVILAARDPNPLVGGRGIEALAAGGVEVLAAEGEQRLRAERQNEKFRVWMESRRPFVLAKWAQTLDGKTASAGRRSRWITAGEARHRALLLREEYDAVLVGAGTVIADDPLLTRRLGTNRVTRHTRILLDGLLRISPEARVFRSPEDLVVVTARPQSHPSFRRLSAAGARVWTLPARRGRVSVPRLLSRLAREGITSLLVEGGSETLWQFFHARRVDGIAVFLAPRILGGARAPGGAGGKGFTLATTPRVTGLEVERLGEDLLITGRIRQN